MGVYPSRPQAVATRTSDRRRTGPQWQRMGATYRGVGPAGPPWRDPRRGSLEATSDPARAGHDVADLRRDAQSGSRRSSDLGGLRRAGQNPPDYGTRELPRPATDR